MLKLVAIEQERKGKNNMDKTNYEDIIHLPHHVSEKRPRMSMEDRAAQFAPFAALTGYDAAIQETARITEKRTELDESEKMIIDWKLREAIEHPSRNVKIKYFQADKKKCGGAYIWSSGYIKKYDPVSHVLELDDGTVAAVELIVEVQTADEIEQLV